MEAHTYNLSTWGLKQEDPEFQVSLGDTVKPSLKTKRKKKDQNQSQHLTQHN
jgi:hypothetical protein